MRCPVPRRDPWSWEAGAGRPLRVRAPPASWLASVLLAATLFPGCLEKGSRTDPLRIHWNSAPAPGTEGKPRGPGAAEPPAAQRDLAVEESDARRQELRTLHSPLESGNLEPEVDTSGGCRTATCHADLSPSPEIHSRVGATMCSSCHAAEGEPGKHRFRLTETDGGVCGTCHVPTLKANLVHAPVRERRCLNCHTPHGKIQAKLLSEGEASRLCSKCHPSVHAEVLHGPYADGQCLACHAAHESAFPKLTRQSSSALCLGCHNREIPVPGRERPLPNMSSLIGSSRFVHGPIREGECGPCHNAHASGNLNLLRIPFAREFYQPWDPSHYALCFQCHSPELVTEERTFSATGFRDGDRNLHHVHVQQEKGRSCRACHEVHASDVPFHMRRSVPFGGWELPIRYKPLPNGGTCEEGCHLARTYDRTRPAPSNQAGPPPAR